MSKRRLTFEDKRRIVLETFHEVEDFYQLKDIEKICQTSKGIKGPVVKEIVQSLVDDNLIESERIGTSLYYWSFKLKSFILAKSQLETDTEEITKLKCDTKKLWEQRKRFCEDNNISNIQNTIKDCMELDNKYKEIQKNLDEKNELSPKILAAKKAKWIATVDAANAWTDLVFSLKSLIKGFNTASEQDMNKFFEIDPQMDYISLCD